MHDQVLLCLGSVGLNNSTKPQGGDPMLRTCCCFETHEPLAEPYW